MRWIDDLEPSCTGRCREMSTIAEDSSLIFYAEGDDAAELLDLLDEEGEEAVIDHIVNGKLDEIDPDDTPEPEDDDDEEIFEHDDGYVLVYNPRLERLWLYERDLDEDF
jgi:hypothetical protein